MDKIPHTTDTPYKWSKQDYKKWVASNTGERDECQRKWVYIANQLLQMNAPKKVINAAIEIDKALVQLELGYNTKRWESTIRDGPVNLFAIVSGVHICSACHDTKSEETQYNVNCKICKLGRDCKCTPRSKYADNYYGIVDDWVS